MFEIFSVGNLCKTLIISTTLWGSLNLTSLLDLANSRLYFRHYFKKAIFNCSYFRQEHSSPKSNHIGWVDYTCLLFWHLKADCSQGKVHSRDKIFFPRLYNNYKCSILNYLAFEGISSISFERPALCR